MTPAPQHFTASQIARALGKSPRAIRRALEPITPDSAQIIDGRQCAAWSFPALPAALQTQLETIAQHHRYRNALALLARPVELWQSPIPLAEIAQPAIDRAVKLQRALARALASIDEPAFTSAQLEQIACEDYTREFGHTITARAIRATLKRTIDRDNGAQNWNRLEIYLPENPPRKQTARAVIVPLTVEMEWQALHADIAHVTRNGTPTIEQLKYLWQRAIDDYNEKLANGKAPAKLKRNLVRFLERNAPFLATGSIARADAIRKTFDRKLARGVNDLRPANSGRFRAPDVSDDDLDAIKAHAVLNCGGRISQAWRELLESNKLSATITGYYLSNLASKSYVPRRIRDLVTNEVRLLDDIHHGPRQAKLNGAHILRDWSTVHSLDWFQADDGTMPIYYTEPDGQGWYNLMRGQVLLGIDLRTTRILCFLLLSTPTYNARSIRTLITKMADQYGLPRKGFAFENGIWRAKILKGQVDGDLPWSETEMGLREFGLRFQHARLPRAKPVEMVMGATQNLMEGLPGYIGRNEQTEKFERVQKQMREVAARKLDPSGLFMTANQWADQLDHICQRYNAARQDGKMLDGLSPDQAFDQFQNLADPPVKFSPQCRYLLAYHRLPVKVTRNGITLPPGCGSHNYRSADTGKLIGQTVLAWFDPETPDTLTVTDTNRKNAFCVTRTELVPAMDAPPELLKQELARIAEHQAHAKARYRILLAKRPIQFRPMIADAPAVELGSRITERAAAAQIEKTEQRRRISQARSLSDRLNMPVSEENLRRPEVASATERLAELLSKSDEIETEETT